MKNEILKLRREGFTYDEIVKKLGCSKSTISYHCKNNGLNADKTIPDKIISQIREYYKNHTIKETANKFNIGTATVTKYCYNKRILLTKEERISKNIERVKKRRRKLKELAVEYKGGCCEIKHCGYNKCVDALEFHHLDPTQKDFGIASKGITRSWDKVKEELDKCIMVCSNCHREIHAGLIKL
jgi:DNA-binding CsgD family transcriptional regulator